MARRRRKPRCIIIAGPNGAGKTTFARRYLPEKARVLHFVNADLIASGLSPLRPELAAFAAARTVIEEIDRMATARWDFGFETTFSAVAHVRRIQAWKRAGYRIEMVYLKLRSSRLGAATHCRPSAARWSRCPETDVVRRFVRSWDNFERVYRPLADAWAIYDNSDRETQLLERGP